MGGIGGSGYNNYSASETEVTSAAQVPSGALTGWPNGYSEFCVAKYEVSQGGWVDFLNTLSDAEAEWYYAPYNKDGTWGVNQGSFGNNVLASGAADNTFSTTTPTRGMNFLNWNDCRAYACWCGLRPMTEMEFEKAGRGASTYGPEGGKATYPWGNEAPSTTTGPIEGGTHTIYRANYYESGISQKPIQVGWYLAQSYANDDYTGASIYGVTDLAGNNFEHMLNCQSISIPQHGNGSVITGSAPDYTGFNWPNASSGKGLRGGGWTTSSSPLPVSYRYFAGWTDAFRDGGVGFRPARILD
ncbi:MAG: SUMF1/EgtB/PvdO family nonheme iron enzyme [Candidatus Latescibacterota bacterium]